MTYKIFILDEKRKAINSYYDIQTFYRLKEPDLLSTRFDSEGECKEVIKNNPDVFKYKDVVILPIYGVEE